MLREMTWPDGIPLHHEAYLKLVDDPVRPHIPKLIRYTKNRHTFFLTDESDRKVTAMVCLSRNSIIAKQESDLSIYSTKEIENTNVHLYTIWSYGKGAGRDLALQIVEAIPKRWPQVKRILTLSPKTEMARKFHLSNGALELQTNDDTVNFEYEV
jgi:hypothetical protein